jgi:hypothetical protein
MLTDSSLRCMEAAALRRQSLCWRPWCRVVERPWYLQQLRGLRQMKTTPEAVEELKRQAVSRAGYYQRPCLPRSTRRRVGSRGKRRAVGMASRTPDRPLRRGLRCSSLAA